MQTDRSIDLRSSYYCLRKALAHKVKPWTAEYYTAAMRNLPDPVRLKAIAIANALLIKRMAEDQATRWAHRSGILT